jgi:hypothetical protein
MTIPQNHRGDITYGRIVCVYREGKKDRYCTRITMGSNLINYPSNCGTPTADLWRLFLNNWKLYLMGVYKYLEFRIFIFDL